jgi:selenoprotein W-related protein
MGQWGQGGQLSLFGLGPGELVIKVPAMLPRSIVLVVAAISNGVSLGGAFTLGIGSRSFITQSYGASLVSRRHSIFCVWSSTEPESGVNVTIKYCSACRWLLQSVLLSSELLTTFADEPNLRLTELRPQSPPLAEGGQFIIAAAVDGEKITLWDRKIEGTFPEAKETKQLLKNLVNPELDLGHSDKAKDDTVSERGGTA